MRERPDNAAFRDRVEAGRRLAQRLGAYRRAPKTVVLGLPRGGVVVAAEIAAALELPLDVLISRKIGAPGNPELAIGAVAEGGPAYLFEETRLATGASDRYVAEETAVQEREIARRRQMFRAGRPLQLPEGGTAILVDDGIATGSTVMAAISALRHQRVRRVVLATPVAPPDTAERLGRLVDDLVILRTPAPFWSVGGFYRDFEQVTDEEVDTLLRDARHPSGTAGDPAAGESGAQP